MDAKISIDLENIRTYLHRLIYKEWDSIGILLPCRDQKREFLAAAIDSIVNQTSPDWRLYVIISKETPDATRAVIRGYLGDSRVRMVMRKGGRLAGALNAGMSRARTDFVCILLSDDMFDPDAVRTLKRCIADYPDVDFFHSSRAFTDRAGRIRTEVMKSADDVTLDQFKKLGSRVKHLLCWRRKKGLEIGGMDEDLSVHGCDDYDFPWRMMESGCKFKAVKECLYLARIHHDFHRLTTHVPVEEQMDTLRRMFKKHGVSNEETEEYVKNALEYYLVIDQERDYDV